MQGLEMGCRRTANRIQNHKAKEDKIKKMANHTNGAVFFDDIYAAYEGDEKHRKYWRSLQSVKPLRFHK